MIEIYINRYSCTCIPRYCIALYFFLFYCRKVIFNRVVSDDSRRRSARVAPPPGHGNSGRLLGDLEAQKGGEKNLASECIRSVMCM